MIYVLAYPEFDADAMRRIAAFRQRHEPARAALVAPHVTLVFGVPDVRAAGLETAARTLAGPSAPFEVSFAEAAIHEDKARAEFKLLLNAGRGAGRLSDFHRALYADAPDAGIPFVAHMTVATASDRAAIKQARSRLADLSLPLTATIAALSVERLVGGKLERIAQFRFAGAQ